MSNHIGCHSNLFRFVISISVHVNMSGPIGGEDFRSIMRHVPSPVMVLTFEGEDGPRGVTIGSFASVSLDPPLVSFNLMSNGSSSEEILNVPFFAIHVLRNDQAPLSEHFAIPDLPSNEQFRNLRFHSSEQRVPVLDDCLAVMICTKYDVITAGDHELVIGKVIQADVIDSAKPLIYFQRAYHEVGESL